MMYYHVFKISKKDFSLILLIIFLTYNSRVKCDIVCNNSQQCSILYPNSYCGEEERICFCMDGYEFDEENKKCIIIAKTCDGDQNNTVRCDKYCYNSQTCSNRDPNTYCDLKKKLCYCKEGYFFIRRHNLDKCISLRVILSWNLFAHFMPPFLICLPLIIIIIRTVRKNSSVKVTRHDNHDDGRLERRRRSNDGRRSRRVRTLAILRSLPVIDSQVDLLSADSHDSQNATVIVENTTHTPSVPSLLDPSPSALSSTAPSPFTPTPFAPLFIPFPSAPSPASSLPSYDMVCFSDNSIDTQLPSYEEAIVLAGKTHKL